MNSVEVTTMCAILKNDKVLMINRKNSWCGWAFPGGHIEKGESITECIKREIKEETGLSIISLEYKGVTHFYNPKTNERHIISNFLCNEYSGKEKKFCDEGKLEWVSINSIKNKNLAEGMLYRLPLFFEKGRKELYVEWNEIEGYTHVDYIKI